MNQEEKNCQTVYKAAVYLRLSREDEDVALKNGKWESNSIANQKSLILDKLESFSDIISYAFYIDDGYTGLNFERPQFQKMREQIINGTVNMVVVKDLSRLGRDYIEVGRYIKYFFPFYQVRFVSVLDHYDSLTATPTDRNLLIPVKNFINDSYSRDLSEKVRSHQKIMRENGLFVGSFVPYGYKKMEQNKNKIVSDAYAAEIVKQIFRWKLEGMSARHIAEQLNHLGIDSPSEYKRKMGSHYQCVFQTNVKAQWSAKTVLRILRNRIYTGVLEQGKTEKVNYKLKKTIRKSEAEWIVKENNHEAIISSSDFDRVSELLSERRCSRQAIEEMVIQDIIVNEEEISKKEAECNRCDAMQSVLKKDLAKQLISREEHEAYGAIYSERKVTLEQEIALMRREMDRKERR